MTCPPLGLTTNINVKRVIDADTIVASFEREITIRFIDFDAPEISRHLASCDEEVQHGLEAKQFLEDYIKEKNIVVYIPASDKDRLAELFSIGSRVRAIPYADGVCITDVLKENGFSKKRHDEYN